MLLFYRIEISFSTSIHSTRREMQIL